MASWKVLLLPVAAALGAAVGTDADCRCTDMSSPCWPGPADWAELNASVQGGLLSGIAAGSPTRACEGAGSSSQQCVLALNHSAATEFWNQQFVGGFLSSGLNRGFATRPSEYVVVAASVSDVQAAVRFASLHNLRLVIKGSGHDYMGKNSATAPGSLLISTRRMQLITWSADSSTVTVQAGDVYQDVYEQAQARGRFVLGAHCPSVGAAGGFSLGAGYGPASRFYGTGADNMLSAVVVVASGEVVVANETSHADLFWALRGGGGGTFGVVISITYQTYPAPTVGGSVSGTATCPDEASFEQLLVDFLTFLPRLFTPHWGNSVSPDGFRRSLQLSLDHIQMSAKEARVVWEPFVGMVAASACSWSSALSFVAWPTFALPDGREIIRRYPEPPAFYPNTGDPEVDRRLVGRFLGQVNQWSFGQAHRYIPRDDIEKDPPSVARKLVELTKFQTSYRVLHLSKGLAGGANQGGNVSANPDARSAGVALMGNEHVANYFPDLPETRETLCNLAKNGGIRDFFDTGLCPHAGRNFSACRSSAVLSMADDEVRACWSDIQKCFDYRSQQFRDIYVPALRKAYPSGSYANEGDYFEPAWQQAFWGESYPGLLAVKRQVDPAGLFVCRRCVGSEEWTEDGNCRLGRNFATDVVSPANL